MVDANVTAIAAGSHQTFYRKNDGSLWAMGSDHHGALGLGEPIFHATPYKAVDANVTDASFGDQTRFVR